MFLQNLMVMVLESENQRQDIKNYQIAGWLFVDYFPFFLCFTLFFISIYFHFWYVLCPSFQQFFWMIEIESLHISGIMRVNIISIHQFVFTFESYLHTTISSSVQYIPQAA